MRAQHTAGLLSGLSAPFGMHQKETSGRSEEALLIASLIFCNVLFVTFTTDNEDGREDSPMKTTI
jgi:hypothetical protein